MVQEYEKLIKENSKLQQQVEDLTDLLASIIKEELTFAFSVVTCTKCGKQSDKWNTIFHSTSCSVGILQNVWFYHTGVLK